MSVRNVFLRGWQRAVLRNGAYGRSTLTHPFEKRPRMSSDSICSGKYILLFLCLLAPAALLTSGCDSGTVQDEAEVPEFEPVSDSDVQVDEDAKSARDDPTQ